MSSIGATVDEQTRRDSITERTALLSHKQTTAANDELDTSPLSRQPKIGDLSSISQEIPLWRMILCGTALAVLTLMLATSLTILTTTQSAVAKSLHVFEQTSWLTSSYLITFASVTPLGGKLASVFSPRMCIFAWAALMALGAAICGTSQTFAQFIFGRVVTGFGGGGVYAVAIVIALELSGPKRRGLSLGILNSGFTLGVAFGATVAGELLSRTGWRALFWMQSPIYFSAGIILLFAIPSNLIQVQKEGPDSSTWSRLARLDYFGAATLTASIVFLLYSLSSPKTIPILPIILSAFVLIIFILHEVHFATDPIISIALLKSRGLLLTCLASIGYMMARWSVLFYMPTYAIAVRQWSPTIAGSILIPTNIGFACGGMLVGWLHIRGRGSFYLSLLVTLFLFPLTLLSLAFLCTQTSSVMLIVLAVFLNGGFAGATVNYTLAHILHVTPPSTHYVSTALASTFRGFGGSFGTAIGGGLFTRTLSASLEKHFEEFGIYDRPELIRELLGWPATVEQLTGKEREAAILGYQDALGTLFICGAALALVMILVQAGAGWKGAPEDQADGKTTTSQQKDATNAGGYREIEDA